MYSECKRASIAGECHPRRSVGMISGVFQKVYQDALNASPIQSGFIIGTSFTVRGLYRTNKWDFTKAIPMHDSADEVVEANVLSFVVFNLSIKTREFQKIKDCSVKAFNLFLHDVNCLLVSFRELRPSGNQNICCC